MPSEQLCQVGTDGILDSLARGKQRNISETSAKSSTDTLSVTALRTHPFLLADRNCPLALIS